MSYEDLKRTLSINQFLLPIGLRHEDGTVSRIVTLRPMTGRTEEILADNKNRENPVRALIDVIVDVVVSIEGVPRVNRDVIRQLDAKDLEFLLVANYVTSFGDELEFVSKHDECRGKNEVTVDLRSRIDNVKPLEDDQIRELQFELPRGYVDRDGQVHKAITIVPPTAFTQEQTYKQVRLNSAGAVTKLLMLVTKQLGSLTHLNPEVFKEMTKKDRDFITKKMQDLYDYGVDLKVELVCSSCGEEYTDTIPTTELMGE